jgi:D-alanine-D-alanine ligase
MNVAILFDGASAYATEPDMLILGTVEAIEQALLEEGNKVTYVPIHMNGKWIGKLQRGKFDLAFNMCEGIDGVATLEPAVIGVLELFGIPFTGASSYTTNVCLRKHVINTLLDKAGLPVPRFGSVRRGGALPSVGYPAIVKPAAEDASLGIEQRSVVRNSRQLAERVHAMLESWEEIIVQRYIDGREVNVGLIGDTVLPISEIVFDGMPAGSWKIVTYQSKWITGSEEDLGAVPRCPAKLTKKQAQEARDVALAAWKLVGGTGYGRVDMRIDADGRPWILEVNANPDIAPDAGLARMAGVAGMSYSSLIREICELGLSRPRDVVANDNEWAVAQRLSGVSLDEEKYPLALFAQGGQ